MKESNYGLGGLRRSNAPLAWGYFFFSCFLTIASLSLATQKTAAAFAYSPALGQPLGHAFGIVWYFPWKIFSWWNPSQPVMQQAVTQGQMLFVIPQMIALGFIFLFRVKPKGRDDLHGSAHWAKEEEIEQMGLLDGHGIYVGGWVKQLSGSQAINMWLHFRRAELQRYLRHNGPEHVLLYAPTRSGKGVGVILPTLLSYPDSTVTLDIKGENWALTAGWRQAQGHTVLRFDPSDSSHGDARVGTCFNPLEEVRLDTLKAIPDVQNIATMIVDPEGKGLQDYWAKAGFAFIAGALMHCLVMVRQQHKRSATLNDLGSMLADPNRSIDDLFQEMLTTDHAALVKKCFPDGATGGDHIHAFIAESAREMLNKSSNEASGVVGTAVSNLALYRDPVVAMNTAKSDFRVHDLMNHRTPVDLYLVVSPTDINRVRPLLRLILNLIISRICERMEFENGLQKKPARRLLMLLDEFTSIGKMEIVNKSIAYAAGYGINYLLVIQNIEQLNETYGKESGIKGNCHVRIAYAPNTLETAKELSEMAGKATIVTEKTSLSGSRSGHLKNASVSISETARPLLTPDECMRLPGLVKRGEKAKKAGDMLIFVAGQPPIYGRQILYFHDPVFSTRAKMPTPVKSDVLDMAPAPSPKITEENPPIAAKATSYADYLRTKEAQ
jgi:type IV secretion system protein VirD4